ncbi:MAG: hypothetical protein U0T77_10645 [Chitinophagales bacterium]
MNIPYPEKYKFDYQQYKLLNAKFGLLMSEYYEYGSKSAIEKLLLSILLDTASKFRINEFEKPKKTYTKTLKYHEAFALLSFVTYILQFEADVYWRAVLEQTRIILDKKVN